jgi:hypothetical protein
MKTLTALSLAVAMFCYAALTARSDDGRQQAADRFAFFSKKALLLTIPLNDEILCRANPESLLNWTIDSEWHGSYFVWLAEDVPQLVGCYLTDSSQAEKRVLYLELHALTARPIDPVRLPSVQPFEWQPDTTGLIGLRQENVEKVHADAGLRLKQMRDLARRYSATMYRENRSSSEELRLLPKPMYRFPRYKVAETDGALFAFVSPRGTDPDLILQLRAVGSSDGPIWEVIPLRFTTRELVLKDSANNSIAWTVPQYNWDDAHSRATSPYAITVEYSGDRQRFEQSVIDLMEIMQDEAVLRDTPQKP